MLSVKGNKGSLLEGKKITICVSGSVAAVRVPELARELMRHGADIHIVASDAALELVGEKLLEWASENKVVTSLTGEVEHIRLGAYADLVLVCPATANTISKIAMGIGDTPVTSTVTCAIGAEKPVLVVPAMHESMFRHPIVADNLQKLESIGVGVIYPHVEEEKAKLASNSEIAEIAIAKLSRKTLAGKKIVITAGPTYEAIDAVRGIANLSSGKMGIELAKAAYRRGADTVLVYGPGSEKPPSWIRAISVVSAWDMGRAVKEEMRDADALISAAAIADYAPAERFTGKISSGNPLTLKLKQTPKLVSEVRALYPNKIIVGFKLEAEDLVRRAYAKLLKDGLDLIIANSPSAIGSDESEIAIVSRGKSVKSLSGSKAQLAGHILDELHALMAKA